MSDNKQMTITEFLEARITEDEVSATLRECHREDCGWIPDESGYSYPCNCGVPERMAAEAAAKRKLLAHSDGEVLAVLACVYASHPAYQQEWAK